MTLYANKNTPFINPQSDYGFKHVFGNERYRNVVIKFIDAALDDEVNITDVKFHNKEVLPSVEDGKLFVCVTSTSQ